MTARKFIVAAEIIEDAGNLRTRFLDTRRDCAGHSPCWVTIGPRRFGSRGEAKRAGRRALTLGVGDVLPGSMRVVEGHAAPRVSRKQRLALAKALLIVTVLVMAAPTKGLTR